ncbi:hypothetical protein EGJ57_11790 [Brucella anthropi]|uniref:hypothetical protein n=1 Tax=Brucella anthropi TaxID=529 RepID=UPI000F6607D0|nr:hypothetical protein [Brucella anthropi]RRY19348.1 hypothetical protein EGJ57_11790 [Brucella anthropi]
MTVLVGIPVLKDARRFHIEKGRRWSIFEHVVLESIAKTDGTIEQLHQLSNLPRRVLIEIIIRLMRPGWVEIYNRDNTVYFRTTSRGRLVSTYPELPPAIHPTQRFLGYAIELATGSIFYSRDLTFIKETEWTKRTAGHRAVQLEVPENSNRYSALNLRVLSDVLLEDDEEITRVEVSDWKPSRRIALASVNGDKIEGLGANVPDRLLDLIVDAASKIKRSKPGSENFVKVPKQSTYSAASYKSRGINFRSEDVIFKGQDHRDTIDQVAKTAQHNVVVHSTFIDFDKGKDFLGKFRNAINRGVKIDILWGKSDDKEGMNSTRIAATKLHDYVIANGLSDSVRVHLTSTRSHSKILVYDRGDLSKFAAVVGSCNWLSTPFESMESSIKLRESGIVSDVLYELAELAKPLDGQVNDFSISFARMGQRLANAATSSGNASAQLVLGHEHAGYVLRARDEAKNSIFLVSHRIGLAARPTLISLAAAARANNKLTPVVYFGKYSDTVNAESASSDLFTFREDGVTINAIQQPRIHSKILAWDDNNAVITSQNWLSADPGPNSPRDEIGVYLSGGNAGRHVFEKFQAAKNYG